jgi:hypothetical protein
MDFLQPKLDKARPCSVTPWRIPPFRKETFTLNVKATATTYTYIIKSGNMSFATVSRESMPCGGIQLYTHHSLWLRLQSSQREIAHAQVWIKYSCICTVTFFYLTYLVSKCASFSQWLSFEIPALKVAQTSHVYGRSLRAPRWVPGDPVRFCQGGVQHGGALEVAAAAAVIAIGPFQPHAWYGI